MSESYWQGMKRRWRNIRWGIQGIDIYIDEHGQRHEGAEVDRYLDDGEVTLDSARASLAATACRIAITASERDPRGERPEFIQDLRDLATRLDGNPA